MKMSNGRRVALRTLRAVPVTTGQSAQKTTRLRQRLSGAALGGGLSRIAQLGLVLALSGCLDNKLADDADGGTSNVFIAQQEDFQSYPQWMTYENQVQDDHGGVLGTTTVYLKKMPPVAATSFPVGTLIVKTMQPADTTDLTIHAMCKRGNGFNPSGTLGWEFFELSLSKAGSPFILWRGDKPPSGEQYQAFLSSNGITQNNGMNEGDCNSCHQNGTDGTFGDLADLLQKP
jgi:hypothetical protein